MLLVSAKWKKRDSAAKAKESELQLQLQNATTDAEDLQAQAVDLQSKLQAFAVREREYRAQLKELMKDANLTLNGHHPDDMAITVTDMSVTQFFTLLDYMLLGKP